MSLVQESAQKVIDYFERLDRRWVNHMPRYYSDDYKEDCLVTSMTYALESNWTRIGELTRAIHTKIDCDSIGAWNDEPGRTYADVKNVLESIVAGENNDAAGENNDAARVS
jgi:hypothetical protein